MMVQDKIGDLIIEIGKDSPNNCSLTDQDNSNKRVEIWLQDWTELKNKIDKMFAIVNDTNNTIVKK